jgi:hypothetical protein
MNVSPIKNGDNMGSNPVKYRINSRIWTYWQTFSLLPKLVLEWEFHVSTKFIIHSALLAKMSVLLNSNHDWLGVLMKNTHTILGFELTPRLRPSN